MALLVAEVKREEPRQGERGGEEARLDPHSPQLGLEWSSELYYGLGRRCNPTSNQPSAVVVSLFRSSSSFPPARLSRTLDAHTRAQAALESALHLATMAMITVCGFPCSGKSTRAQQLANFVQAKLADPHCPPKHRARKVVVLNDESLGIHKHSYDGALPLSFALSRSSPRLLADLVPCTAAAE